MAEIHQHGTMYLFMMVSYVLVIPVTAHLFVPLFYNCGALTVFEVCLVQKNFYVSPDFRIHK